MMKGILSLVMGVLLFAGAFVAQPSQASGFVVEIGDRPYYTHGEWYSNHGYRWCWRAGHWRYYHHHREWIHGHYTHCH